MTIERLTEMGIDSVRQQSLVNAIPVLEQTSGKTMLQNTLTGEFLRSFCAAHRNYNPSCKNCHLGIWRY